MLGFVPFLAISVVRFFFHLTMFLGYRIRIFSQIIAHSGGQVQLCAGL